MSFPANQPSLSSSPQSFLKFFERIYAGAPTAASLLPFGVAPASGQHLKVFIETLGTPGLGGSHILQILQEAFPRSNDRRWIKTDTDGPICNFVYNSYAWLNGAIVGTPLIIVHSKPGPDGNGDECAKLNRIYSSYALSDVHIMQSGAPCFLVSITENVWHCPDPEVEVFETVFRNQGSTVQYQELLATQLFALQDAVEYLPKIHFGHDNHAPNLPNAFTTFEDLSGVVQPLRFERQLEDKRCMFLAVGHIKFMVKLTFRPYSYGVHEVLHAAGFSPKLLGHCHSPAVGSDAIIMEWLPPPTQNNNGWMTVHDLFRTSPELVYQEQTDLLKNLNEIINILELNRKVHGGLGTDNVMVLVTAESSSIVKPVKMKVVDMDCAGDAGKAFYPVKFSDSVGYPGQPGAVIDAGDHAYMAAHWKKFFNSATDYSLWRIL
ncbi:hypothetical protein GALMADRAFT_145984 [Galerina marginata CBS 339.88]|uniref:Protein kinase domain-containing protein n=1 Tax=Galerina marginata (strain CBS 339.88) TaxID=685588 RepID=A0A067SMR8_GALM3|nr:hypothetical protein GALMADRAFT_145984 [Galerina marginata CBS 339.88]